MFRNPELGHAGGFGGFRAIVRGRFVTGSWTALPGKRRIASAETPITRINRSVATVPDCGDHTRAIANTRSQKGMTVLRVMRMAMRGLFLLPGPGYASMRCQ
jgi:hypothetical protein